MESSHLQDVTQEVHIVAFEQLPTLTLRGRVQGWLYGLCMNAARTHRRLVHLKCEVVDERSTLRASDECDNADSQIRRRELASELEEVLAMIDEDQRTVFILFEFEDLTGKEIARALDIPVATVYSRMRLAQGHFAEPPGSSPLAAENPKGVESP